MKMHQRYIPSIARLAFFFFSFFFSFSLFEMHGGRSMMKSAFVVFWPYNHTDICFLFPFYPDSKCMEVDKWYIARLSSGQINNKVKR